MKITKLYRLFTVMCLTLFCLCNVAMAQTVSTTVSATVIDEQGSPLSDVNVFGPKGAQATTDANGQFEIEVDSDKAVVIQKQGYESGLVSILDIGSSYTLIKSAFLASDEDEINTGITTKDRRHSVGAISTINTKDRLINDNTQWVRDYINGLLLGMKGSGNVRGLGNALFVIDGVIGRDPNILNMEEVEQITVLKDANSVALYGSQGRNGVVVINTKRGKINRKEVNVNVRSGIRTAISTPNYLGSARYMQLFNEARVNDGLDILFDPLFIQNTAAKTNVYRFPDVDFYSDEYMRDFISSTTVLSEFSGGSEESQYYVNIGWNRSDSWVKTNPEANAGSNRFNVRGNIDFKVNDWITSSLDGIAILTTNKSSLSNLLSAGATFKPNSYAPLLPASLVDATGNPELEGLLAAAGIFNGFLLGTTQQFQDNTPVANAIAGGYQNNVVRATQFNNAINFDLDMITKGLSAKTYLSFDFYDSYRLSIQNKYRAYEPTWTGDAITGLTPYGDIDQKDLTENVSTNGFVSRLGFYGLVNYENTIGKNHGIKTTVLAYYNSEKRNNVLQSDIDSHLGLQVAYDYKKKMFVDISAAYVNSIKLPEGNRGDLSPTVGVGYILSEESFLKESNFVDYLKVKASGGIIKSDQGINGYYLYSENYSDGNTFTWADGQSSNRRQSITQGENLNLGYEERIDLNVGFEGYFMKSLWIEANYFKTELDKQLTFLNEKYPSYYNTFRPYDNFNKNQYTGFEMELNYTKNIKNWSVSLGANVLYNETQAVSRSEVNEFDYQNRVGRELSSIFGLVDQGFYGVADFEFDNEGNRVLREGLPVPNFGAVQPGDLKYTDQNNDGIIDNDDRIAIGQTGSPWTYGVNLNLKYKRLNLFVLGTGQTGAQALTSNSYYQVNGTDKYSEVVLGRWTPDTANTATFPRLSSQTNQNNFRPSTFWMYDNSYFSINRAQLTYELNEELCDEIGVDGLSVNLAGTNLLEISENRDIRQLRIGTTPMTRSYTVGLRMSF